MSQFREEVMAAYHKHGNHIDKSIFLKEVREHPEEYPASHERIFRLKGKKAQDAWYEVVASQIIREVRITVKYGPETIRIREFVNVENPSQTASFQPIATVAQDPFMAGQVMRNAQRDLRNVTLRYKGYSWYVGVLRDELQGLVEDEVSAAGGG